MKKCIICGQNYGHNGKYCSPCGKMLRENRKIAYKLKAKYGIKLCPICFVNEVGESSVFCGDCRKRLFIKKAEERQIIEDKKTVNKIFYPIFVLKNKAWSKTKIFKKVYKGRLIKRS